VLLLVVALPANLLVASLHRLFHPYSRFVRMAAGLYHADTDTGRPKWAAARKAMPVETDSTPMVSPFCCVNVAYALLCCGDGGRGLANAEALAVTLM
jgi:hypothetical protein